MVKKILCFLSIIFLALSFISCSKEENELKDPVNDNKIENIYFHNLYSLYSVGDIEEFEIVLYPSDVVIEQISYESSDEEVIKIIDNKVVALKEGKSLITITINGIKEYRLIEVEKGDDEFNLEIDENSEGFTSEDWYNWQLKRQAKEEEAQEKGFSSYREYREYLSEEHKKEIQKEVEDNYQKMCDEAKKLGLTYEDYICLQLYDKTYDFLNNNANKYGYEVVVSNRGNAYLEINNEYLARRNDVKLNILTVNLEKKTINYEPIYIQPFKISLQLDGTYLCEYGHYYFNALVMGKEIKQEDRNQVEELLSNNTYYLDLYDYLVTKIDILKVSFYMEKYVFDNIEEYLLNNEWAIEDFNMIEKEVREYEKNNIN